MKKFILLLTLLTSIYGVVNAACTNPTLVSVDINDPGQVCEGTQIFFTATPTGGGTNPSYQWFLGTTPVGANSPFLNYTVYLCP